jgi:Mg/Co/Ni transporter MgtE
MMSHENHAPQKPLTFDTAMAHTCTQVPVVSPTARAGEIWAALRGRCYESATHLVVCEGDQFRGILRIEEVLVAPAEATVQTLMDADPPVVAPGDDQEIAAWQAVRHQESALAVVDASGRFVGLIPPHRLLAACSTATVAAMMLPWLLDRLGLDPAFGSGPLATVVQDLLSIVIYFAIATVVLG